MGYFLLSMDTQVNESMYPFVRPSIPFGLLILSVCLCVLFPVSANVCLCCFSCLAIYLCLFIFRISEPSSSPDPQTAAHPGALCARQQQRGGATVAELRPSSGRLFQVHSLRPTIGRFPGGRRRAALPLVDPRRSSGIRRRGPSTGTGVSASVAVRGRDRERERHRPGGEALSATVRGSSVDRRPSGTVYPRFPRQFRFYNLEFCSFEYTYM